MNGQSSANKSEETFNIPFKQLSSNIFFSGFFFLGVWKSRDS